MAIERAQSRRLRAQDRLRWMVVLSAWLHLFGLAVSTRLAWSEPRRRASMRPIDIVLVEREEAVENMEEPVPPREREPSVRRSARAPRPLPVIGRRGPPPRSRADRRRRPVRRDAVAELQEALGFQRPMGSGSGLRMVDGQPRRVAEPLPRVHELEAGDLRTYLERVEAEVNARWQRSDLSIQRRGLGIQGRVGVRYRIDNRGRVEGLELMRSSGIADLDLLAMRAVPSRLPPPPRGLAPVHHEVLLTYRNPLVEAR